MNDFFLQSVRTIRAQDCANQVYDILRLGQARQDFLVDVLAALEPEFVPAFCRQLSKRIAQAGRR